MPQQHSHRYAQTTTFTCGPACLVQALNMWGGQYGREDELQIWREANTIYMGEGLPGTSAFGLALAARKRGLATEIYDFDHANLFALAQGDRPDAEQDAMLRVIKRDEADYQRQNGEVHYRKASPEVWRAQFAAGGMALVLALDQVEGLLHWVLVTALDDRMVTVHDPFPYTRDFRRARRTPAAVAPLTMAWGAFWRWIHHPPFDYQTVLFVKPEAGQPDALLPRQVADYMVQYTDFTCGPACLMTVQKLLQPETVLYPEDEYLIWRRTNTVYMVDGHPGCGPYGLALEAQARGLPVRVQGRRLPELFLHWNARARHDFGPTAAQVLDYDRLLAEEAGIPLSARPFGLPALRREVAAGRLVMLLDVSVIAGHWLVIKGYEDGQWQVHDPLLNPDDPDDVPDKTLTDAALAAKLCCPVTGGQVMVVVG